MINTPIIEADNAGNYWSAADGVWQTSMQSEAQVRENAHEASLFMKHYLWEWPISALHI